MKILHDPIANHELCLYNTYPIHAFTQMTHTHTGNTRGVDVGADLDNKRYLSGVE